MCIRYASDVKWYWCEQTIHKSSEIITISLVNYIEAEGCSKVKDEYLPQKKAVALKLLIK